MSTVTLPDVPNGLEDRRDMAIANIVLRKRISIQEAADMLKGSWTDVDAVVRNKIDDAIKAAIRNEGI